MNTMKAQRRRGLNRAYVLTLVSILLFSVIATAEKWLTAKATHFIVYYQDAPEGFIDDLIDKAENYYETITDDLGFRRDDFWLWSNRAEIYVYDDAGHYQEETGMPVWSHGAAVPQEKIIRTFPDEKRFFDTVLPHELGHIIFREFVGFRNYAVPLWLDEGVASYQEKGRRDTAKKMSKDALKKEELIPLVQLGKISPLFLVDKKEVDLFYAESLNLVDYLISEFGKDSFVSFCQALRDKKNLDSAIRTVYPFEDLEELDEAWQKYLK